MKTHTIRKRRYKIVRDEVTQGYAELPEKKPTYELYVGGNLKGRLELETVIHEFAHAWFTTGRHEMVEPFSADLAKFLWRWGYRRVP